MSSSSSDENETTIHRRSGIYTQPKAGSSKRSSSVRHDVSDADEDDEQPRRRLNKALGASNCVREQVYYLRRKPSTPPPTYYHRLNAALHTIVKESFGEEYRKVATVLGLVEALAEVLILEVHTFGIPESNAGEHRNIRKLIANALTNLTYGQILSKRRLCSYDGFIRCVVRIIIESPNITQVYAGLIRNLSWNADSGMSEALQPTVNALSIAAVYAHTHRFDVTAILSALWNLAGHSVENKRTICDTPNCLKVLASLLSPDAKFTSLVDSATGILKYVSQYLATNSTHLELRSLLISRMLTLLKSASFTCVTNTLGAIAHLIAKDPHMQQLIRQDVAAVQQLNVLRNSNRDDIRKAVKEVLNTLNQPCSSHRYGGDMSHSVGGGASGIQMLSSEPQLQMQTSHHAYHGTASPRLLSLRATRASPGKYIHPQQQMQVAVDQRSSSLPRHFAIQRNGFMMAQSYNQQMETQQQIAYQMHHQQQIMIQTDDQQQKQMQEHHQQMLYLQQQQQQQFHQLQQQAPPPPVPPPCGDDDLDIPTSTVMGTRSNSDRSLGSMNPGSAMTTGGWNSTLDTAANSSRALSPVSFSDIPASPTMCAQVFNLGIQNPTETLQNQMTSSQTSQNPNTTHYSNGSANTMTRSDGATTIPMDNIITPTYATVNPPEDLDSPDDVLPGPALEDPDDGDYAIIGGAAQKTDDELLTRSIQSEMPTSSSTPKMKVSPRLAGFFSPTSRSQTSPILKPSSQLRRDHPSDADRLLMESIMSEMPRDALPHGAPRANSKNGEADRRDAYTASHESSDQGFEIGRGGSQMQRMESLESHASSDDDSFGLNGDGNIGSTMRIQEEDDVIDRSLPMDCCVDDEDYDYTDDHFDDFDYEDQDEDPDATQFDEGIDPQLTIDCSMISSGSGGSGSSIPQKNETSGALATSTPKGSSSSIPGVRRATRVATNGKTRLPVPKTNGSLVEKMRKPVIDASRPRLPPKPTLLKEKHYYPAAEEEEEDSIENQTREDTIYVNAPIVEAEQEHRIYMNALKQNQMKLETTSSIQSTPPPQQTATKSAIVTPYNYQKPPFTGRSNGEMNTEKSVTPNPKQMLVTIV
ncbi:CRE-APR-1 protein [Caenorhabditis remanei]|uniref:CRE-APR-1 protein n=1 Tax=Caenorhabditis remanei TaxID=31234 RepID=E3MWZ4_CAERE|nr:CRE-APR-1 protein [Caenorhabditis remanei]